MCIRDRCETDFVAKNEGFVALTKAILDAAVAAKAKSLDEVKELEEMCIRDSFTFPRFSAVLRSAKTNFVLKFSSKAMAAELSLIHI